MTVLMIEQQCDKQENGVLTHDARQRLRRRLETASDSRLRPFTTNERLYGYMMPLMHFAILWADLSPVSPLIHETPRRTFL